MKKTTVADLGTILGIWAHPDDETWMSAGVMAAAIANGQKVVCLTATKGDAGQSADQSKWSTTKMSQIRETEIGNALSIIGVHELHWLNYKDGQLAEVDKKKAVNRLVRLLNRLRPDTVLTFEPKGLTGHKDHKTISSWAVAAAKVANYQPTVYGACETTERYNKSGKACSQKMNIYFATKQPFTVKEAEADLCLHLSRSQAKQKLEALKAHGSQTAGFFNSPVGRKYMKQLSKTECFVKLT